MPTPASRFHPADPALATLQTRTPGRYREPRNFFPGRSPGPRRWPPAGGGAGAKKERKGGGRGEEKGKGDSWKLRRPRNPPHLEADSHIHSTYPAFVRHRAANRSGGRRPWTVPHPTAPADSDHHPPGDFRGIDRKPPEPALGEDARRGAPVAAPWNPRPARATPSVTLPARRRAGGGRVSVDSRSERKKLVGCGLTLSGS